MCSDGHIHARTQYLPHTLWFRMKHATPTPQCSRTCTDSRVADSSFRQPGLAAATRGRIHGPVLESVASEQVARAEHHPHAGGAAGGLHCGRRWPAHRDGVAGGRLDAWAVVVEGAGAAAGWRVGGRVKG